MKIHPTLLLSVVALLTLNLHCEKDETTTPPDQLPPYTEMGANTIGCMVNGRVFIPIKHDLYGFSFGWYKDDLELYIDRNGERVYIAISDKTVTDTGVYDLTTHLSMINHREVYYQPPPFALGYVTNPMHTGQLHIQYWDKQSHIMSGTFYFDAISDDSSIVHITDGRFDMIYN